MFAVRRAREQRKQIEDSNKALQLELDRLTSLDAVEQKATALGFAPSDPHAIVQVQAQTVAEARK